MFKPVLLSLVACLVLTACGPASTSIKEPETPTVENSHNTENSLDWAGVYQGVMPCADCEGIETQLTLHMNNTYQLDTTYLGKDATAFQQQGKFEWDSKGAVIQLLNQNDGPAHYKVMENQLIQLDMAGELITGDLAKHYKLMKQTQEGVAALKGVRWTLTELMGQPIPKTEPDMTPYLQFEEGNKVSGFTGCNQFAATYEVQGLRLTLRSFVMTEKLCLNGSTEEQFLNTIQGIDNYTLNDSGLAFYKARTAALIRFTEVQT